MARNAIERFIEDGASIEVSKCLSCSRSTCDGCPWERKPQRTEQEGSKRQRRWVTNENENRYDLDLFLGLYNAGLPFRAIAQHMGMSANSIRHFIEKHGLRLDPKVREPITRKELEGK